jgi:hypothetical protein
MAEELRNIIDSVRTRLHAELDGQLEEVAQQHALAVAEARRAAGLEADDRWFKKLQATEQQGEQRTTEAIGRMRLERDELERTLGAQRDQAWQQADEERRRAAEQLDELRAAFEAEREAERKAIVRQPSTQTLLESLRKIDEAANVSQTLAAMVQAAAAEAPRAALFIINDGHLDEWSVAGITPLTHDPMTTDDPASGVIGVAARERTTVRAADDGAAAGGSLPHGHNGIAVPLLLDGEPVGVLYGDDGQGERAGGAWPDVIDIIARHGGARLGYLTAVRTAQAMRWLGKGIAPAVRAAATDISGPSSDEEEQAARRYARLLVSEIKLYNESAVRLGCEHRDLLRRLQPEIDRALRLYDERVPATLPGRAEYFDQELIHTLAGGDASLLG